MIQVVTCIMVTETDWKKLSKGLPSFPTHAMATPVTMENTTKPKMLVPFVHSPLKSHVFLLDSFLGGSGFSPG